MAYQQNNNYAKPSRPNLAQGGQQQQRSKGKQEWVTLGVGWNRPSGSKLAMNTILNIGGYGLKVRAFWTDKSKSNSKNPSDVTFTIPMEEIPEELVDMLKRPEEE